MSKIFTFLLLFFSLFFISIVVALGSFLKDYRDYNSYKPTIPNLKDGQMLETLQYEKLQQLASYPIIGQLYLERLVKEMVMKKQWDLILDKTRIALASIVNKRSYRLWYYKAIAQCSTFQFLACRKSLYEVEVLAPVSFNDQISSLLEIFNLRHKSHLLTMRKQIQVI